MKYQQQTLKVADALTQLKNEVTYLQTDLDKYKASKSVITKVVFYKEQQIKSLTSVLNSFTEFKEQSDKYFTELEKTAALKEEKNFKFEGICLLHGIRDFNFYLNKPTQELAGLLKQAYTEKWREMPIELNPQYKKIENIKIATMPSIDFNELLNGALNNQDPELTKIFNYKKAS